MYSIDLIVSINGTVLVEIYNGTTFCDSFECKNINAALRRVLNLKFDNNYTVTTRNK
jgi:hypothetical protein